MLVEILTAAVAQEPDVVLLGDTPSLDVLQGLVCRGEVDVVILGLSGSDLDAAHYGLFDADARVRILALAEEGRVASLYELRPYRTVLDQGSPQELIQSIRSQVRSGTTWSRR